MPRQPDDYGNAQSELEMLEHVMNSMIQNTFSSFFRGMMGPSIFDNDNGRNVTIIETTGGNQENVAGPMDDFGGSDFRKLASKSRNNKDNNNNDNTFHDRRPDQSPLVVDNSRQPPSDNVPIHRRDDANGMSVSTPPMVGLMQLLFGNHADLSGPSIQSEMDPYNKAPREGSIIDLLTSHDEGFFSTQPPVVSNEGNGQGSWSSFTSTSQRRIIRPDGTEETFITRSSNGITETVKRITHPDGTVEETRETGNKNHDGMMTGRPWKLLSNQDNHATSQPPKMPENNIPTAQNNTGILSGLWKRWFG
ncbi:hypothetical protein VTP01DRAFT_8426 [Rhizomucor pusillus]|uniref:uncharacterized protein n=1 Tax=Rhizomucor pusillus TaxID=4840 RepID=UPI0037443B4B